MGNSNSKKVYYSGGVPHHFNEKFHHSNIEELQFVSAFDRTPVSGGDECYIISEVWLNSWLEYVKGEKDEVGVINNSDLIDETTKQFKSTAIFKTDYRTINKVVWEYYFQAYGGGPVIAFYGKLLTNVTFSLLFYFSLGFPL
jgi:hypothetical protein